VGGQKNVKGQSSENGPFTFITTAVRTSNPLIQFNINAAQTYRRVEMRSQTYLNLKCNSVFSFALWPHRYGLSLYMCTALSCNRSQFGAAAKNIFLATSEIKPRCSVMWPIDNLSRSRDLCNFNSFDCVC
jgi:hypothetical protein